MFIQEPLVELAGPKHYKHLYEIMYYYDYDDVLSNVYKKKHFRDIAWMQTPYQPLVSLDGQAKKVVNYMVPERVKAEYRNNIRKATDEALRYNT